ncbi:phage portal protein, lambda family [Mesorhizobium albiziae]|uniref:Phage portal protein, lambda family n=1 Tax=Neomesorhizobium albiziae TaxID=335020 RepID=A0A1I3YCI0_9HYPH|nr:phage portal protein [Mesorhizobium albiziae]GLS29949.1 phage portal protein [Mesorhizobium albiziae]SFK29578.1 phage portal protein, lambda family [Mesorhizobium albiziae]
MNALDRIIGAISPVWGARRVAARQVLDTYGERAYAAAKSGRRNKGWSGRSTSANGEIGSSLRDLRNRSREFVRDSWAGQRMLDVLTSHVVGTGIVTVPNTGSDRLDKEVKLVFEEWAEQADVEGFLDWSGIQALTVRSMIEGGDTVVRYVDIPLADAGRTVPFRLQGLEGDSIDTSKDTAAIVQAGRRIRLGVQMGVLGRREGLHLFEDHPSELGLNAVQSNFVAWSDLSHIYRPLRFGQVRGVPWFASILLNAREVQDLIEATLVKARTEACFAGFIRRTSGGMSPLARQNKDDTDGKKLTRIEPGMLADIGDGEITFASPSSQTAFGEVYMTAMQAMAAGAGITYDQLTGDLRQANYSSLRAGKIEFRRLVEQVQWTVAVPQLIAPVHRRLIHRAVFHGRLKRRRDGYPIDHIMPAVEPIDPKKDLEADILAVRAGRTSPQEFIAAWGRDWRKVVEDTAAFYETIDKQRDGAGLALDIDARKPMKGSPDNGKQTGNGKADEDE